MVGRKERSDAFKGIRALGEYRKIHGWLMAGVAVKDVAVYLRERGHFHGIQERSLVRTLQRLRSASVPSQEERLALLDALAQLRVLAAENESRISAGIEMEEKLGRLLTSTREAVEAQVEILAKSYQLKKLLGFWRPSDSNMMLAAG